MSQTLLAAKMTDARERKVRVRAIERKLIATIAELAALEPDERASIVRTARAQLTEIDLAARLDPDLLDRIGAGWVAGVADLAHTDALAAAQLSRNMWRRLSTFIPEMPGPIDCGVPEPEQTP